MNEVVKSYYQEENDVFGYSQKFKGMEIYPIKVKDLKYTLLFNRVFCYPKNSITVNSPEDLKILKMSYLSFIVSAYSSWQLDEHEICDIIGHITKKENVVIEVEVNSKESIPKFRLNVDGIMISEPEFDDFRELVLEQNGSSIEYVNQFNADLEEKLKLKFKMSAGGDNNLDFKDQIFTLSILLHKTPEEIGDMTIFQLQDISERLFNLKTYDTFAGWVNSGLIKLEHGNLKPYLYHRGKKGRYDDILMSHDKFETEIVNKIT